MHADAGACATLSRTAYNHAKINALFSLYHGIYFLGLVGRYSSYSFGNARSCLGFQAYSSLIVHTTKICLGKVACPDIIPLSKHYNSTKKPYLGTICLANYLDDNFGIGKTKRDSDHLFDTLEAVTEFVGGKMSDKKKLKSAIRGILLGLLICCGKKYANAKRSDGDRDIACIRVPSTKTIPILAAVRELRDTNGLLEFSKLETVLGQLCFLSYHSLHALLYTLPLIALKWMPRKMRAAAFRMDHPLYHEIISSITWWVKLLTSDDQNEPILWRAADIPSEWISLTSDSSGSAWAIHDYRSIYLQGAFKKGDDRIIAAKELQAVNEYIRFANPDDGSGLRLLCDNMQVFYAVRKGAVSPKTNSDFKKQYWEFARLCEQKSLSVIMKWISTNDNFSSDLGTRDRPLLANASASAAIDIPLINFLDSELFNQGQRELRLLEGDACLVCPLFIFIHSPVPE